MAVSSEKDALEEILNRTEEKSDISRVVAEWFSKVGIAGKSDLTDAQITLFWVFNVYHKRYGDLDLGFDEMGEEFMHLRISRKGSSRKGFIEWIKSIGGGGNNQPPIINGAPDFGKRRF